MFSYDVRCQFNQPQVAEDWLKWLQTRHLQDVLDSGVSSATIVRLDTEVLTYEIRYLFPDRQAFELYEKEHAPRLRAEGLSLFPLELGLGYQRMTGTIVHSI